MYIYAGFASLEALPISLLNTWPLLVLYNLKLLVISSNFLGAGELYMWGKNKTGCLGFGHTRDQFFPFKVTPIFLVKNLTNLAIGYIWLYFKSHSTVFL